MSESHSIAESITSFSSSVSTFSDTTVYSQPHTIHKSKSITMFSNLLKKSRSRNRLRADSERSSSEQSHPIPVPPLPETYNTFRPILGTSAPPSPTSTSPKRDKMRGKRKLMSKPPPLPSDSQEPEFHLDTNFDKMDGIVDLTALPTNDLDANTPGNGFGIHQSSTSHPQGSSGPAVCSPTTAMFSNPFLPISTSAKRQPRLAYEYRKVSPKSLPCPPTAPPPTDGDPDGPSWSPPESWAVEKEGEDAAEPESTSSDESGTGGGTGGGRPASMALGMQKRKRRRGGVRASKQPSGHKSYHIRIYRATTSYHVARIGLTVTVAELTPVLNQKLLLGSERETHRLYLKERGKG
jgi:adenylate cyclase